MTTPIHPSLIDDQLAEIESKTITLAFTHPKWHGALSLAWDAGIENVHAWSGRACMCGEWTVKYEVRA